MPRGARASLTLQLVAIVVNGARIAVTTEGVKSEGGSQAARATKAGAGGAAVGAVIGGFLGADRERRRAPQSVAAPPAARSR